MKKKLAAFTIMEVTIAMLISALVIGIAYSAYLIVGKTFTSFFDKNFRLTELMLFEQQLKKDISASSLMINNGDGIILFVEKTRIRYQFQEDQIVRSGIKRDTFRFRSDSLSIKYEGHSFDKLSADSLKNKADDILFVINYENELIPFYYKKIYSSEELISPQRYDRH